MEIERGAHIQKPQLKKRSTRLSLPGIDFDGMQKQSPPLLSPRRMLPAADQPTAQGGRTASASTTHTGSFRCRFHMEPELAQCQLPWFQLISLLLATDPTDRTLFMLNPINGKEQRAQAY
ncbi:hypothetical protein SAY87_022137 [Trapa incisa]|uniref:Uncharacterized protein n=1 Tax=Trapa incisa TaxID=236973 RepID=A0AAN7JST5_9MYRT|nr:hypothetical protein SAY87_022137 [Trapa incisa]